MAKYAVCASLLFLRLLAHDWGFSTAILFPQTSTLVHCTELFHSRVLSSRSICSSPEITHNRANSWFFLFVRYLHDVIFLITISVALPLLPAREIVERRQPLLLTNTVADQWVIPTNNYHLLYVTSLCLCIPVWINVVLYKHCLKDIVCITDVLYMLTVLVFVLSMLLMSCLNASHLCVIFISLCLPLAIALTHACIHSLTHSFTHSLTHSLTHLFTYSLTHPLTHSLIHPLTHTHSLCRWQARKAFTAKFLSSKLPQVTAYRQVSTSIIHSHIDTVLVSKILVHVNLYWNG